MKSKSNPDILKMAAAAAKRSERTMRSKVCFLFLTGWFLPLNQPSSPSRVKPGRVVNRLTHSGSSPATHTHTYMWGFPIKQKVYMHLSPSTGRLQHCTQHLHACCFISLARVPDGLPFLVSHVVTPSKLKSAVQSNTLLLVCVFFPSFCLQFANRDMPWDS